MESLFYKSFECLFNESLTIEEKEDLIGADDEDDNAIIPESSLTCNSFPCSISPNKCDPFYEDRIVEPFPNLDDYSNQEIDFYGLKVSYREYLEPGDDLKNFIKDQTVQISDSDCVSNNNKFIKLREDSANSSKCTLLPNIYTDPDDILHGIIGNDSFEKEFYDKYLFASPIKSRDLIENSKSSQTFKAHLTNRENICNSPNLSYSKATLNRTVYDNADMNISPNLSSSHIIEEINSGISHARCLNYQENIESNNSISNEVKILNCKERIKDNILENNSKIAGYTGSLAPKIEDVFRGKNVELTEEDIKKCIVNHVHSTPKKIIKLNKNRHITFKKISDDINLNKDNVNPKNDEPEPTILNNDDKPQKIEFDLNDENILKPNKHIFISDDPDENEDNNNPEWKYLKNLKTDEERYCAVRKVWKSQVVPDPNVNLSYFGFQYRIKNRTAKKRKLIDGNSLEPCRKRQKFNNTFFNDKLLSKSLNALKEEYKSKALLKSKNYASQVYNEKRMQLELAKDEIKSFHRFYCGLPDQQLSWQNEIEEEARIYEEFYNNCVEFYGWNGNLMAKLE